MEGAAEQSQRSVDTANISNVATSQTIEALKDIAFGSVAGIIGKYVEYPFDTVKVRLQSQPSTLPLLYTGPLDCFRQSIHRDGFLSLYRGISAPLIGAAIETSSLFFGYRVAQDFFRTFVYGRSTELPMSALVACGAASGAFTSLWLTPIELVKCQMQVPLRGVERPGPLRIMAAVYRRGGVAGFWHGQLGTLIRETGGTAAWFGAYEGVSAFFRSRHTATRTAPVLSESAKPSLPLHEQMLAGAAAGMSYNFLFYPADTIKSCMQTEEAGTLASGQRSFWTVGKALWQQRGLRGLYQGCGITVGRAAPSSALIFTIYEALRQAFD